MKLIEKYLFLQFIGNLITFALLSDNQQVCGGQSFTFYNFFF